jgi:hypothetical protein
MRFGLAIALLLGVVALAASTTATSGSEFRTAVRILDDASGSPPGTKRNYYPHFTGTVRSPKDKCEPKRTVELFRETAMKDPLVGSDETNKRGRFRIVVDKPLENDFYAIALEREIAAGLCADDKSPVFHHDGP